MQDYLNVNRANWDARAEVHVGPGGYDLDAFADPRWLSQVVRFDLPRLGDIAGLDGVHLQCHIGTDTVSLARLGARMTGVDLSPVSLQHARALAERAGADIDYVESEVYSAPEALDGRRFDFVYTGVGAINWLPSIARWAETVAQLLRPGGFLFIRDAHPVLCASSGMVVRDQHPDRRQQPWMSGPGEETPALEFDYWERPEPIVWRNEHSYAGDGSLASSEAREWNHALSEIIMAVLNAGLKLEFLEEHDSVPWDALPGLMTCDDMGEYRLGSRPGRLPATFTLRARAED